MSLRTLLILMALVSTTMVAAVIYTKVLNRGPRNDPSLAELRALERVCEAQCERDAPRIVAIAKSAEEVSRMANACLDACVKRALDPPSAEPPSAAAR
jgi:hypothetical protein